MASEDDPPSDELLGIDEEPYEAYEEAGPRHQRPAAGDPVGESWDEDESGHTWAHYFHEPVREPYGGAGGTDDFPAYGGRRFAYGRDSGVRKEYGQLYGYDVRGFGHRRDVFYAEAGATPWWEVEPSPEELPVEGDRLPGRFAGIGPRGYKRPDVRIEEEVVQRLEDAEWVDATDVEVEVADGVVTLGGEVATRAERRAAEDIAAEVAGVVDVINRLRARQRRGYPS
jgi:hypothetical protein